MKDQQFSYALERMKVPKKFESIGDPRNQDSGTSKKFGLLRPQGGNRLGSMSGQASHINKPIRIHQGASKQVLQVMKFFFTHF